MPMDNYTILVTGGAGFIGTNLVNRLTGNKAGIVFKGRRDWDVKTRLLSCITKAEKILGYTPKMKFEDGLKETHHWFVENWENIEKSAEFS
jgi:UDP-glucose 4-epimerase